MLFSTLMNGGAKSSVSSGDHRHSCQAHFEWLSLIHWCLQMRISTSLTKRLFCKTLYTAERVLLMTYLYVKLEAFVQALTNASDMSLHYLRTL